MTNYIIIFLMYRKIFKFIFQFTALRNVECIASLDQYNLTN